MTKKSLILENVSVEFETTSKEATASKQRFNFFNRPKKQVVKALNNISIEINEGERVGILGLNGAGKSTLLRVMAGIYRPHKGKIQINGHVNPMFELATGVEFEMTGWENIALRAQLLGINHEKIPEIVPVIGEFTELGEFLNYPVKTYSSGMFARLAFAVSTAIDPEILLLDEIVGAGDLQFEDKAAKRMNELIEKGSIIVFTSHNMHLLEKYCERTIWLKKGEIVMDGDTPNVTKAYISSKATV
ncbi:ABC transporter ATP-binding protein [Pseudoalteromonas sp. XMcav1-K]|uniref:ABC transporter ATP-binding protein n=1 Tax=Pseudoalteromonas sp. XMcav1-K TaxID=3374372 RepID=UPI003756858D